MGRRNGSKRAPRTHVIIIQDTSGSMQARRRETIEGYNEYIDGLQHEDADVRVTLTQFNSQSHNVFTSKPIKDVHLMRQHEYNPYGSTSLYDAIGDTLLAARKAIGHNDRVLVVIMTDGYENSSQRWNHENALSLIDEKRDNDWEFIFLGAGSGSWSTGQSLGFDYNHSINYGDSGHSHTLAWNEVLGTTHSVLRGSTADCYLASSNVKSSLESEAGYTPNVSISWSSEVEEDK